MVTVAPRVVRPAQLPLRPRRADGRGGDWQRHAELGRANVRRRKRPAWLHRHRLPPPTPSAVFTVTGTAASVAGLANGTAYTFSVSAFNAIGTGPAAAAPAVVTKDVPARPTGVVAVPGDQLVNLTWAEPSSTGGSPVTGYSVSVTPASPSAVVSVTGATANVTPLSNGTAYTSTVAAVNAVGTAPASTPSAAVTPSAPTASPSNLAYSSNPAFYTVAMSKMAGSTRARWFDPSNGTYTPISGSPFANSGQQTFTPPASTADGYPDFVLVLQSP
jgi:hypothetical protein